jgi:serine/threonine protein kinase
MGTVYLAEDLRLGRKVAIKLLATDLAADVKFRERFVRESRLAASLEDPNVIPIYDSGEADGELFIAMRYVPGTDLKSLIEREGALAPERAVSIIAQVGSALDAAHALGLVHRDVKPANILLVPASEAGRTDKVYLSDFGLSRRTSSDSGLTNTGQFVGSIDYAAPEQFEGKPLTGQTDVYSLGCVLYESLTGQPPFPRDRDAAVMFAHLQEPPPKATTTRPELPPSIDSVVARGMAKAPEDRFQSGGALAEAARAALRVVAPTLLRGRRWPWLAATAALLAVVAVVVVALSTRHSPPASPDGSSQSPRVLATPPANSVVRVDPGTGRIEQTVTGLTPGHPFFPERHIQVGEGGVWVNTAVTVQHIDPQSNTVVRQIRDQYLTSAMVVGQGAIWTAGNVGILRISPATDELAATIKFDSGAGFTRPVAMVVHGGDVWVLVSDGRLLRIDAGSNEIIAQSAPIGSGDDLAVGQGALWAIDRLDEIVFKLDWSTGEVSGSVHVGGNLDRIVAGPGGVWVLDRSAGVVIPIDPATMEAGAPIRVGTDPVDMAIGLGAVWILNRGDGSITRIDANTAATMTLELGGPVASIAVDESTNKLWVYLTQ